MNPEQEFEAREEVAQFLALLTRYASASSEQALAALVFAAHVEGAQPRDIAAVLEITEKQVRDLIQEVAEAVKL